jgi:hypothetical protein
MSKIDWKEQEELIRANFTLSDAELAYALEVLAYAKTKYSKRTWFPGSILLLDKNRHCLHIIKIKDGQGYGEEVELPFISKNRSTISATIVAVGGLALLMLYFRFLRSYNFKTPKLKSSVFQSCRTL